MILAVAGLPNSGFLSPGTNIFLSYRSPLFLNEAATHLSFTYHPSICPSINYQPFICHPLCLPSRPIRWKLPHLARDCFLLYSWFLAQFLEENQPSLMFWNKFSHRDSPSHSHFAQDAPPRMLIHLSLLIPGAASDFLEGSESPLTIPTEPRRVSFFSSLAKHLELQGRPRY